MPCPCLLIAEAECALPLDQLIELRNKIAGRPLPKPTYAIVQWVPQDVIDAVKHMHGDEFTIPEAEAEKLIQLCEKRLQDVLTERGFHFLYDKVETLLTENPGLLQQDPNQPKETTDVDITNPAQ